MIFEYEKPIVEIVAFLSETSLARQDDDDRIRATTGGDGVDIPDSFPEVDEDVGDW